MKLPLKGSKEYNTLVTMTGLLIGLGWVAKAEYANPKWTGVPKAVPLGMDDLQEWNKQFGPSDMNKWAIPAAENSRILQQIQDSQKEEVYSASLAKKDTW